MYGIQPEHSPEDAAKLLFAQDYPFARPESGFLFHCDEEDLDRAVQPLGGDVWRRAMEEPRTPVVSSGSNAAPVQLRRKYRGLSGFIPVVPARLHGYDAVYCPLLTSYGSVPATLQKSVGSVLDTHVTYLTREQLERMHLTEGGYDYCYLSEAEVVVDSPAGTESLVGIHAYLHKTGCLLLEGSPLALSEQSCAGRVFPPATQMQVSARVAEVLGQEAGDAFVLRVINGRKKGSEWSARLQDTHSAPFEGICQKVTNLETAASSVTW